MSITTIVFSRNNEDSIFDTINSVQTQTLQPSKIIVLDNNSTDGTLKIIKRSFKDIEIVEHKFDKSFYSLRLEAISLIKTPYVSFISGGNLYYRNKLQKSMEYMQMYTKIAAVYSDCDILGKNIERVFHPTYDSRNILAGFILEPDNLFSTECIKSEFKSENEQENYIKLAQKYMFLHVPINLYGIRTTKIR